MPLPLQEVTILDLSRYLAGPYCTMLLGDLGADVIKIERFPGGDDVRGLGPKVNGESYPFAALNRHKRSVAVDLQNSGGQEIVRRLVETADIVIENFRPGVTAKLGVDYESLRAVKSDIVYCSITGFGQTGPYAQRPGFDIIAQGMTGFLRMTGNPGERPAKFGIAVNDLAAGMTAASAVLAAYIHKLRSGTGQYIDISLLDSGLAWTAMEAAAYWGSGELPEPTGTRHRRIAPYQAYKTADGYVTVGANNSKLWESFCRDVIGKPEWLADERYLTIASRLQNADALEVDIEAVLAEHPSCYWVELMDQVGVPGGDVYEYDQALQDPHVSARNMIQTMDHAKMGKTKVLGFAPKFSETPLQMRRPSPTLGEHTVEVLQGVGCADVEINAWLTADIIHDSSRSLPSGTIK